MKPTISVIVPVYNAERYLHKCLDSIINQTYTQLEIILVDDGSPDNCGSICDDYAKKDDRIKVIHQKNKGISCARNSGLNQAIGDYIGFVDSDDWIHEKMYETLITQALLNKSDLTSCVIKNSSDITKPAESENLRPIILDKKELLYNYFSFGFYIPRNLYSKKLITDFKFDENIKFVEDMFFSINIIEKVDNGVFIEFPFYIYNDNNDMSLTRVRYNKNTFLSLDANIYIQRKVNKIFPNDIELHNFIKERIMGNCLYHLQNLYLNKNANLDQDGAMKRKSKQIYNDNFIFFKNPSAFKTVIRLLNISWLKYFYHFHISFRKQDL
jgi:glycosyltransferase involved in cell wall biosynthesis